MSTEKILAAIGELGGPANVLSRVFSEMEWAEDEIAQAQKRHPAKAALLWEQFMLMHTDVPLPGERVYRAHCRELLERVAAGGDTRPPTDAELCGAYCQASLAGPPPHGAVVAYMRAFTRLFPGEARELFKDVDAHEQIGGFEADQTERDLRRKLTVKDRVPRQPEAPSLFDEREAA